MNDENQQDPNIELQDLEQAFKEEASVAPVQTPNEVMEIPTPANKNSFSTTKLTLQETDTRLKTKIQNLKNEASDGLKKLKELKNTIAQKIADIKELEETREKIKKELEKITSIEQEVSSIKEEAENELA